MEKNPISFLQEYAAQSRKTLPNYTITSQTIGTHMNSFNIRVSYDELVADGVGASKKEAKLNATMKMLGLLNINLPRSSMSLRNTYSYNNNNNSSPEKSLSSSPSSALLKSPSNSGINYIGKLQEYVAVQAGGSLPEYVYQGVSGPPHNPEFTFLCKYKAHSIAAKGNSKKEAKMQAAQKMYEIIFVEPKVLPETKVESYIDTLVKGLEQTNLYNCNKKLMEQSVEKALKTYPKLTTTFVSTTAASSGSFKDYHMLLKNKFLEIDRELIIDKLRDTMEACISLNLLGDRHSNPMGLLKTALKHTDVIVKEIRNINTKSKKFFCSLQLNSLPVINEIGYGENEKEAEVMAIFLIAKTLIMLL